MPEILMIDYEQLKHRLRDDDEISWVLYDRIKLHINAVATEVVHGRWETPYDAFHDIVWTVCSCCKHTGAKHFKYCPNCGAKMDLEDK